MMAAVHPEIDCESSMDATLAREIHAFILAEAELLDEQRFDEWVDLFADDGKYWMPLERGQTDPEGVASIFYDDKEILTVRMSRVRHPTNLSQDPVPRTSHLLGSIRITKRAGAKDTYEVGSRILVTEYRQDGEQRVFSGKCAHVLRRERGAFKIALKRVELINCDAPHAFISLPI